MDTFDIHDARTHLSRLVERAAGGEPKPAPRARLGALLGQIGMLDDFKDSGREEIEHMFYGDGSA